MTIEALYAIYLQNPSVQTDTRKLRKGDLFFALRGPSFNGNAFAEKALESGAAYAVIDDPAYARGEQTLVVEDTLATLQALAYHHRQQFGCPFLAITGSNGKTTTKELIHAVLSQQYQTATTEGNLNNHIGVPLTLLKIKKETELAVVEMGANHQGEIASYCRYAAPTHGLITNVGKAHLEGFGGEAGVRKGKGELFDYLREKGGTVFLMKDYPYLEEMSSGISSRFTYGTGDADISGNITAANPFLEVHFTKGFEGTVRSQLVGAYNLPNLLAAVAVGLYFQVPAQKIKQAIEGYAPSNSRSQLVKRGKATIVLDAYNANPSSMKAAIENFAAAQGARKILALGGMAELGTESLQEHAAIVEEISRHQWEAVLLVGGDFQKLSHPYLHFDTPGEAGEWLRGKTDNAHLLVKGSRSMQMEKLLEYIAE